MSVLSVRDVKAMSLYALADEMARRLSSRRRIGPWDWSRNSEDMRLAMGRAVRAWFRVQRGVRISVKQGMDF